MPSEVTKDEWEALKGMRRYPWHEWVERDYSFPLVRGEDFHCSVESMRVQVYQQAKKRGLKAVVMRYPDDEVDGLLVHFFKVVGE